jgi:DNA-3-methyladenine glycosylase II
MDPAMARIDDQVAEFDWPSRPGGFTGLVKMVVGQQVSVAAADSIWKRFETGMGQITPSTILASDDDHLRSFGLSRPKARYAKEIALAQISGAIDFDQLDGLDSDEAMSALTAIKGVGHWTAATFLMFSHGHCDLFPAGDVILQEGLRLLDGAEKRPAEKQAHLRAEAWRPYRGIAAMVLWRFHSALRRGDVVMD